MKTKSLAYLLISTGLLVLLIGNCKKDEPKIIKEKITGSVQKGPFVNGTTILMSELNSTLQQTGNIFTTQILNNDGSFEITNITLTSSYVEFLASGFYFDEVIGTKSIAPLNLYALSDITDISTVNVNILTHLEKQRVDYLVKHNKTFSEAKKTAQGEILAIFGFSLSEMDASETLDISVNNESNAILLAISIILQGNRSVGDLTELLADITNDIREDGILNSEIIMTNLRNSTKELSLTTIRTNLENRYQELGFNATIPDFEKYIHDFLVFTGQKPTAIAQPATNLDTISATLNGAVNPNSLNTIVTFEYGTSTSYGNTILASQSPVTGSSSINISADIAQLLSGTTYHFRVITENALGTIYSSDLTFYTHPTGTPGPVQDIEGNIYSTVRIGNQIWMAENLKTTKYNNGDLIGTTLQDISGETTPKYQWACGDNESNVADYGRLYTWYAVTDSRNVCPTGWHVPSDAEWKILTDFLGGENVAGDKLKETGTSHWIGGSSGATNETGFTALPGGNRTNDGIFWGMGEGGYWWSTTVNNMSYGKSLGLYSSGNSFRFDFPMICGISVRCLMD